MKNRPGGYTITLIDNLDFVCLPPLVARKKNFFAFGEGHFLLAVAKIAHFLPLFSQFLTVAPARHTKS